MEFKEGRKVRLLFLKLGFIMISCLFVIVIAIGICIPSKSIRASSKSRRELPIYCVDTREKRIALSFDTEWGNEDTQTILNILEYHNIKATFFMTGSWLDRYPEGVKIIAAAGHDLGNHSENHERMSNFSREQCMEEIRKPHEKVKRLTGIDMQLFRTPYGDYSNILLETAKESKYYSIQWDVDSLDWMDQGVASIIDTVCNNPHLGPGSIILCHNGARYTKDALETIITTLQAKGYEFVPISELIYKDNYYMDYEGRQFQK